MGAPGAGPIAGSPRAASVSEPPVILAGLAGSLRGSFPPGRAFIISTVIAPDGRQYRAAIDDRDAEHRGVRAVLASSAAVLTDPEEKRAFAEKTGADLVDLEGGIFAEAATMLGWRWMIVKGVSDGPAERLPPRIGAWVGADGRVRAGAVAASLLRRPWDLRRVRRLRAQSVRAMEAVAELVARRLS
jgi:hypothetical protein